MAGPRGRNHFIPLDCFFHVEYPGKYFSSCAAASCRPSCALYDRRYLLRLPARPADIPIDFHFLSVAGVADCRGPSQQLHRLRSFHRCLGAMSNLSLCQSFFSGKSSDWRHQPARWAIWFSVCCSAATCPLSWCICRRTASTLPLRTGPVILFRLASGQSLCGATGLTSAVVVGA